MAKTKKQAQRIQKRGKIVRVPRNIRSTLDEKASLYAQLLADPCHGPLVTGPFGDSGGGFVSRFEGDYLVNTGLSETGAAYAFTPGKGFGYVSNTPLTSDLTAFNFAPTSSVSPGFTFLVANASSFRCLSACLQVYWPGTELLRSGIISLGQTQAGQLVTNTQSTAAIRATSQYVERMPDTSSEIVWRPNNYDLEWTQPNVNDTTDNKFSSLVMTSAGFDAASVGIRVRVVVVYEWQPLTSALSSGLVQSSNRGQLSTNTFQDVVRHLDSFGDWMYHGALATGKAASSILRGVKAVGRVAYGASKVVPMLMG